MTNHIRQRIPGGVDKCIKPQEGAFSTINELFEIPFVKRRMNENFDRWTIADGKILMAEMKDGRFWAIGYLANDIPELPRWVQPLKEME